MTRVIEQLKEIVGPRGWLEGTDIGARYSQDLWTRDPGPRPALVVRPATTAEVAAVLRCCSAAAQPVVPQGGMTGLVSAGVPAAHEVVLSLERMDAIEELDLATRTMVVQAGAILQTVHERAEADGLSFPLDLASRGSCTIGGCLATNAGGNRVLLHGMTRDLVLGVEAVLADGTVLDGLHRLPKNNAGYDLRQLFIGSEGTLGVITRAVLRLRPRPSSRQVAFCALDSFASMVALLHRLQARLPGMVSAFEAMWASAYAVVAERLPEVRLPLAQGHPYYVLVECQGGDPGSDPQRFADALTSCDDLLADAVVGEGSEHIDALWSVRERLPEAVLKMQPLFGFDISLPIGAFESFLGAVDGELRARWPAVELVVFGHLGDGNVHIAVVTGERTRDAQPEVETILYRNTQAAGGSISAEHGIGFEKRPYLHYSRTAAEIVLMRRLKRALDPHNILNPGRVFPPREGIADPTPEHRRSPDPPLTDVDVPTTGGSGASELPGHAAARLP